MRLALGFHSSQSGNGVLRTTRHRESWQQCAGVSALLFACLLFPQSAKAQLGPAKRILIFNEAGPSYPAIDSVNQGIQSALAGAPYKIEIYSEFLETILFPEAKSQQGFRNFYLQKYKDRRPDVIITIGPSPLRFMLETHKEAFPEVPIVFCMPMGVTPGHVSLDSGFTGVETDMAAGETLDTALQLRPGTKHVVVVGGVGPYDRQLQKVVREQLKPFSDRVDISYMTDSAMPELLEQLRHLPEHTIVLFTTVGRDAAGVTYKSRETGPLIASASNAPVFTLFDMYINHGEIGGNLFSMNEQGKAVGRMVLRVLNGEKPRDIPPVKGVVNFTFDARSLQRWGIAESALPPGSIVLNRQLTFWQLYKKYAISGIFILLAQTVVILALLWQRTKRRKTETELVASNELLHLAMEKRREIQDRLEGIITSAMDAVIAMDEEQRIIVFNPAAEKMFGCLSQDAIGTRIDRFIPDRFRGIHRGHIERFGESGTTNRIMGESRDLWALKTNGQEFPIESSISQIQVGGRKLFTVLVRDISDRKQAEEARFRHAAIVESSDDAIISFDLDGAISSWNIGAQRMYGYAEVEVLGQPISIIVPIELQEQEENLLQKVRVGEEIEHYETVRLTKNGKRIDVSVTISPLRDWTGKIVGCSKIARDITLPKLAEAALRESEERFRFVTNNAPVMIWMSGTDKLCTFFNQPWLDFTGRSLAQERGNGWAEGVHAEDLERCLTTYEHAFDTRESFETEYRLRRHDGVYRWVVDLGVPRFDPGGAFLGYIGSCIDVTERKQAEEILSTVSRRLIEAHEEERSWVARELHDDVNQRLALIAVNLDVLKQGLPAWASEATRQINDIREQIKDLGLDVQALSHRLHSSKLEYLGLTAAAAGFCREFSERKMVHIDFQSDAIPKTVPKEVTLCLFRVLQEALQNAAKHSGSQNYRVSLRYASDEIKLTISDFGRGFDPEEAMKSRGLGITSMRERVKLVEGKLSINSSNGSGTVIRARVPLPPRAMSTAVGKI